jgi:hypothetical protein
LAIQVGPLTGREARRLGQVTGNVWSKLGLPALRSGRRQTLLRARASADWRGICVAAGCRHAGVPFFYVKRWRGQSSELRGNKCRGDDKTQARGEERERARAAGGTSPPRAPGLAGSTPSPARRLCCCVFFTPLPRDAEGVRLRCAARPLPCHACVHSIDAGISRCRGTHV